VNLRCAKQRDRFSPAGHGVKIFEMFDDGIAAVVEQGGFESLTILNVKNLHMDIVVPLGHRLDAIDHRRTVVVAVGESHGAHRSN
jgi:hypothetical protein